MPNRINRKLLHLGTAACLLLCALLMFYGWRNHLFTSQAALQDYIAGFGAMGAVIFVVFQVVQVVFPILPGGLGCLGGVLLFGPWLGFLYNYIGICIGSLAAFVLAKYYGRPLLRSMFGERLLARYERWTVRGKFNTLFALAIFLPVAPDDLLCYLAGTTPMSLRRFAVIILLGKPAAIALYSLGLTAVFRFFLPSFS